MAHMYKEIWAVGFLNAQHNRFQGAGPGVHLRDHGDHRECGDEWCCKP